MPSSQRSRSAARPAQASCRRRNNFFCHCEEAEGRRGLSSLVFKSSSIHHKDISILYYDVNGSCISSRLFKIGEELLRGVYTEPVEVLAMTVIYEMLIAP